MRSLSTQRFSRCQERCEEAIDLLQNLRSAQYADKQFPHAGQLAECYYQVGRMAEAKEAYREAFEMPDVEALDQIALRDSYQAFRKESRPLVAASATVTSEGDDDLVASEIEARVPFGAGWALGAQFGHYEADDSDHSGSLRHDRANVGAGLLRKGKGGHER